MDRAALLERLRRDLASAELDGILVSSRSDVFYLSGFTGSSGVLLVTDGRALLFSDFRYRIQAVEQAGDFEFVEIERHLFRSVGRAAADFGASRLGYNESHLTCEEHEQLAEGAGGIEFAKAGGLVERMREMKTPEEIDRIRRAAALADRAMSRMMTLLEPGRTEREIAIEGEFLMRREGAEAAAFDMIVASGPRSALPHAETTERKIEPGDMVVIDIGARALGYCSDMTRSFAVRSASKKAKEIYELVYHAQRTAAAEVRAGAKCGDVDSMARTIIENAGYGDAFGHGLGHGVGIEVHEAPRLGKGNETVLKTGHVITVEPGIYIEGEGGIRLEDLLAVEEDGAETLTGSEMPPELPIL